MSIKVKIWFESHDIKDVELHMDFPPREGDNIVFPPGFIKYYNGAEVEENSYKVNSVDFMVNEYLQTCIEVMVTSRL